MNFRGGGGAGSSWHESGSGLHKKNSVYDFASCGKYLVEGGFIREDWLCAIGSSAGCLAIGAAINMYPRLLRAAILKVNIYATTYLYFLCQICPGICGLSWTVH